MHQMPHWATEISTAKQGIPELSAIQYYSVNAGELARLISICSLVSGWQGCELDKSSMQLGKNDKVEFFSGFSGDSMQYRGYLYIAEFDSRPLFSSKNSMCLARCVREMWASKYGNGAQCSKN